MGEVTRAQWFAEVACCMLLVAALSGCGGGGVSRTAATRSALTDQDLFQLGEVARQNGDAEAALALYARVISEFSSSALADDALVARGDVLCSQGKYDEARLAYQSVADRFPSSDRLVDSRLAIGSAFAAEFDTIDGGTPGFVDIVNPTEFLVNSQAEETFRRIADDTAVPAEARASARLRQGEALFTGRRYAESRAVFAAAIGLTASTALQQRAHLQSGLAFVQEKNALGAEREFLAAGATVSAAFAMSGSSAQPQLGTFLPLPGGPLLLDDIVIVVRRAVTDEATRAESQARADLGMALVLGYVENDTKRSASLLRVLASRKLRAPLGDLVLFQLAEVLKLGGDLDSATREYQTLLSDFPASALAQRANQRIGERLFELFSVEASAGSRIDGRLLLNLIARLRRAVGDSPQPEREARTRALTLLGRLDGEGIPLPLTIAQPGGLLPAVAGVHYRQRMVALGATGPVGWGLAPGRQLPDGLSLAPDGLLSGIPASPGRSFITVTARDEAGSTDSKPFLLDVAPLRIVSLPRLPDAVVGRSYAFRLEAEGAGPITFQASLARRLNADGSLISLPGFVPGVSLAPDGVLSGTPTQASGGFPFLLNVQATDAQGRRQSANFSLFVVQPDQLSSFGVDVAAGTADAGKDILLENSGLTEAIGRATAVPSLLLTTAPPIVREIALTPDGKKLVFISGGVNNLIGVVDLETHQRRELRLPGASGFLKTPLSLEMSPDGRLAAVGMFSNSDGQLLVVDIETLTVVRRVDTGVSTQAVAFTPDGKRVLARSTNRITSVELQAGTTASVGTAGVGPGKSLAVFQSSRRVLIAGGETSNLAAVVDLESGSTTSFALPGFVRFCELISDDALAVLVEGGLAAGNRLFLLDLRTGVVETLFVGQGTSNIAVSVDGTRALVPAVASAEVAVVDLPERRVRRLRMPFPVRTAGASIASVAITPDGRQGFVFDFLGRSGFAALVDLETLQVRQVAGFEAITSALTRRRCVLTADGSRAFGMIGGTLVAEGQLLSVSLDAISERVNLKRHPLASAVVGRPYAHAFAARGGTPMYRFGPAGPLKAISGLTLSQDGRVIGTPSEADLYALDGSVTDASLTTTTFVVPLLVRDPMAPEEPLNLLTPTLPQATASEAYEKRLAAIGGRPPYRFAVEAGELPAGFALSADGVLSGLAGRVSTQTLTISVRDSDAGVFSRRLTLEIIRPGLFEAPRFVELLAPPNDLVAVDLNRDGRQDLAVAHQSSTTNMTLLTATAAGGFSPPVVVQIRDIGQPGSATAGAVNNVATGDFNGDGQADLLADVFPGLGTRLPTLIRPTVVPLLGDGAAGFTLVPAPDIPRFLVEAAVGDLNGDGKDDIVAVSPFNNARFGLFATTFFQLSEGDGLFSESARVVTSSPLQALQTPVLAQFTGDRWLDLAALVYGNPGDPLRLVIFPGRGDGTASFDASSVRVVMATTVGSGDTPPQLAAADLNRDGRPDFLVVTESPSLQVVLSGSGDSYFEKVAYVVGSAAGRPLAVDLNRDEYLDVAIPVTGAGGAGAQAGAVVLLFNAGDGTFDAPVRVTAGASPAALVAGDFNGDRLPDLAVMDSTTPSLTILSLRPPH